MNPLVSASFDQDQSQNEDLNSINMKLDMFLTIFKEYMSECINEKFELINSNYASVEQKFDVCLWFYRFGMFCDET